MQNKIKKFIDYAMARVAEEDVILDVGGGERFQKWLSPYKRLFEGKDYRSMDYDSSTNPDVVGDIHNMPLRDGSIGAVICSSVLEHIENPIQAVKEIHRILKPGGVAFVYVPSIYPYHARKGSYPDYWRFFDDTLEMLFRDFASFEIVKAGGYFGALKFFVPMQHRLRPILDPMSRALDRIFRAEGRVTTSGYYVLAIK